MDYTKTLAQLKDRITAKGQEVERVTREQIELTQAFEDLQAVDEAQSFLSGWRDEERQVKARVKEKQETEKKLDEIITRKQQEAQGLANAVDVQRAGPRVETGGEKTKRELRESVGHR
jgi:hypothetical protein